MTMHGRWHPFDAHHDVPATLRSPRGLRAVRPVDDANDDAPPTIRNVRLAPIEPAPVSATLPGPGFRVRNDDAPPTVRDPAPLFWEPSL